MTRVLGIAALASLLAAVGACSGVHDPVTDAGDASDANPIYFDADPHNVGPQDAAPYMLDCEGGTTVVVARLEYEAPHISAGCLTDADCTTAEPRVTCADTDVVIVGCPVAMASASTTAFADRMDVAAAEFCGSIESGCHSTPSCTNYDSRCVSGACQLIAAP
ncbi:MAG: hypothetical protein GXP55_18415 [Deltaproteobacteria bacterium]|nr:hypothetical protein [Deltaproteobacteria bacterium]